MVSFKALSLLALTGSALAAPAPGYGRGKGKKHTVIHTVIHTAYVTVTAGYGVPSSPAATTTSTPPPPPPAPTTTVVYVPSSYPVVEETKPSSTPKPTTTEAPPAYTPPPQAPSTTSSKAAEPTQAPPSTDTGYMATVNEWRAKLGLEAFTVSSKLEANAKKTCVDGNGKMEHQLNPGSMGQVLAPGEEDNFYHVFVGGWLCERPDMKGMNGVCATASEGWMYTSTGHADILIGDYKTIGCAFATGIWACDLGNEE